MALDKVYDNVTYASEYKTKFNDWADAINEAISLGYGKIVLPKGDLEYNKPIRLTRQFIIIEGQGINSTFLKPKGCHGILMTIPFGQGIHLKNFSIEGEATEISHTYDPDKCGVYIDSYFYASSIENVNIQRTFGEGIYISSTMQSAFRQINMGYTCGDCFYIDDAGNSTLLQSCYMNKPYNHKAGYVIKGTVTLITCTGCHRSPSWGIFGGRNKKGVLLEAFINFISCHFEGFYESGIKLDWGTAVFTTCKFYAGDSENPRFNHFIELMDTPTTPVIIQNTQFKVNTGVVRNTGADIKVLTHNAGIINMSSQTLTQVDSSGNICHTPAFGSSYSWLKPAIRLKEVVIDGMEYYYHGGKKHTTSSVMPTSGYYNQGDYVKNNTPTILGEDGSKYVIRGWHRITSSSNHVINTDWVEDRGLTGK